MLDRSRTSVSTPCSRRKNARASPVIPAPTTTTFTLRTMLGGVTEMRLYDLRVTVERIEGRSVCGLEVGDYFELTESSRLRIPPGRHFCIYALQSVLPFLAAKQRELADEDWLAQDSHICCPDPDERVVMRIERIGERSLVTEDLT